jgi:uncharacterized membrane protein YcaP (DUF421 family)
MWNDLMHLQIPLADKVIRTVAVYFLLAIILRVVGKRDLAQLNSFDLVVMLLLSNVVQNAIIGPDNSLIGGAIGAVVLVATDGAVVRAISASDRLARLLEGTPTVLARDGHWVDKALREEGLRRAEPGGAIVATVRPDAQTATKADVERIEAKLDALLRSGSR